MRSKNWKFKPIADEKKIEELAKSINVSKPIASLLLQRGVSSYKEAKQFFRPELTDLHDPFLMKDMDIAVKRLQQAINSNEKVMVYGDYDVDGTTSVSMMYSFLSSKISQLTYYIPDRYSEGYGISKKGIKTAKKNGCTLIVALDCGIKAVDKVAFAKELGVEFIICDHHEPGDVLPGAVAILDPKRPDCPYPFKELSACGVGFKFIQAYAQVSDISIDEIQHFLDLVVVSIASDIVPIVDENRILAYWGLKQINRKPRVGLRAILDVADASLGELKINDLVFKVGPRINAAGRIELGLHSVDLLVSTDKAAAAEMAAKIDGDNTERKLYDSSITVDAIAMIEADDDREKKKSTVLYNPDWHKGVLGIVASRIIDNFYRPTIILTKSNGLITGSARSVHGFNLYKAVEECSDLLENFGGHMYAAGLTLEESNLDAFIEKFETVVQAQITPNSEVPKIDIDSELVLCNIQPKFFNVLSQFEPFGPGNMAPVFVSKQTNDTGFAQCVGKQKEHLKMYITDNSIPLAYSAIAFSLGYKMPLVEKKQLFDVCYSLEENHYKGKKSIQFKVRDIK